MKFSRTHLSLILTFLIMGMVPTVGADDSISLKYTYRSEQSAVFPLTGLRGTVYLPLMEVARFYGVDASFDFQTRRVDLKKGARQVRLVLSQSVFLVQDAGFTSSYPIEPAETVSGQLGIPPESAGDLMSALLNINVRYLPDQRALAAGGVSTEEIHREILAEVPSSKTSGNVPLATPVFEAKAFVSPVPQPVPTEEAEAPQEEKGPPQKMERFSTVNQTRVRRIIIDAGHGGKDSGAKGYGRQFMEKAATLDIAKKLAGFLKKETGLEVLMTREEDYYISLKYRTDFANRHNGDIFISIHCNSNPRHTASGTETYVYGSKASNKWAALAAKRENRGSGLGGIVSYDVHHTSAFSVRNYGLAAQVDQFIGKRMGQHVRRIQEAPFYVLAGANMPAILIETAFISNKDEENKLRDPYWREKIAKSISEGVFAYRDIVEGPVENRQARR